MTKDDIINELVKIKGIGKAKAEILYKKGFTSIDKLKKATSKDLMKIESITDKNVKDINNYFKGKPKPEKKEKKEAIKSEEKKPKEKKVKKEVKKEEKKEKEKKEEEEVIEEEKYKVKKKPKFSKEQKQQFRIRKQIKKRTPKFLREEWFRYKRIPKNWRRPDGITSKMRKNLKYRPSRVRVGFRGPKEIRGLHSSGFKEIIVYNVKDLKQIDPNTQAARIGSTVGTKKRIDIEKKAEELEVRILNM